EQLIKKEEPAVTQVEVPTTCEMCVNKCSVIAVVENGVIHKLNPNPASPKSRGMLCARGNAGIQQVYDPARLKRPLIRAGERGEGKWRPGTSPLRNSPLLKRNMDRRAAYGPQPRASRRSSSRIWGSPSAPRTLFGTRRFAWRR